MSFSIEQLKENKLTTSQQYDIINFAIEMANEYGFLNHFVFSRALYVFSALSLIEEEKDEISKILNSDGVLKAFEYLIEKNILSTLVNDYEDELELLIDYAQVWFEDYQLFLNSPRQGFESLGALNEKAMAQMSDEITNKLTDSGIQEVFEIADKWGMNNTLAQA